MKVKDYLLKNEHRFTIMFDKTDLKKLNAFADILKNTEEKALKGLMADKDVLALTDSYRIAAITARKYNSKLKEPRLYPASIVPDLKIAESLVILDDYTLALQIDDEVNEFKPIENVRAPRISDFIYPSSEKGYIKSNARALADNNYLWRMLKSADTKDYMTEFKDKTAIVICTPNEKSRLELEVLVLTENVGNLKVGLNCKYLDSWFKAVKCDFDLYIKDSMSSVAFTSENLTYVLMPYLWREEWISEKQL